jgi:hypothetical protein
MSGATVLSFPERTFKPQPKVVTAVAEEAAELGDYGTLKLMLSAVEANVGRELTNERMQLLVNLLAVAYRSLGRMLNDPAALYEGPSQAG